MSSGIRFPVSHHFSAGEGVGVVDGFAEAGQRTGSAIPATEKRTHLWSLALVRIVDSWPEIAGVFTFIQKGESYENE